MELSSYLSILSFVLVQFAVLMGLMAGVEIAAGVLAFMQSEEVRGRMGIHFLLIFEIEG